MDNTYFININSSIRGLPLHYTIGAMIPLFSFQAVSALINLFSSSRHHLPRPPHLQLRLTDDGFFSIHDRIPLQPGTG